MKRGVGLMAAVTGMVSALTGCGTSVPRLGEIWESAEITDDLVYRIKKSIYCELRMAIRHQGPQEAIIRGRSGDAIPDDWGVQLTLTLTVDETGALGPSGAYTHTIGPAIDRRLSGGLFAQSFALPLTTQLSSQASRIDTYYSFFAARGLKRDYPNDSSCVEIDPNTFQRKTLDRRGSSYLLSGNLGIEEWLKGALLANNALPSSTFPKSKTTTLDVLQYNLKFVVMTFGSINPMWKLQPVSTGVGSFPLYSANRTRTHQLLLTLGPADLTSKTAAPGAQANTLHTTGQFEQAVSNAFRSVLGQ